MLTLVEKKKMMKTPRVKATIETMTKEGMKMTGKKDDFPKEIGDPFLKWLLSFSLPPGSFSKKRSESSHVLRLSLEPNPRNPRRSILLRRYICLRNGLKCCVLQVVLNKRITLTCRLWQLCRGTLVHVTHGRRNCFRSSFRPYSLLDWTTLKNLVAIKVIRW